MPSVSFGSEEVPQPLQADQWKAGPFPTGMGGPGGEVGPSLVVVAQVDSFIQGVSKSPGKQLPDNSVT